MKATSASDSVLMASGGGMVGCGCPTTSTVSTASANSIVTVVSRPKSRGIVHSITECGKARLVFEDNFTRMKGVLLNQYEESFSLAGTSTADNSTLEDPFVVLQPSMSCPDDFGKPESAVVRRTMTITVVDSEVGQTFRVEDVELEITIRSSTPPATTTAPVANSAHPLAPVNLLPTMSCAPQLNVSVRHPAISFRTDEVFIGNKAEMETRKYLGMDAGRLARINSRSAPHHHNYQLISGHPPMTPSATPFRNGMIGSAPLPLTALYIGAMTLNIVSMERTAPSMRRVSTCDGCATNIIEQANDFLV